MKRIFGALTARTSGIFGINALSKPINMSKGKSTEIKLKSLNDNQNSQICDPRFDEAKDKIFRLPPPGNGTTQQTNITDYFSRLQITKNSSRDTDREIVESKCVRTNTYNTQKDPKYRIKIIQWNACSLNAEKRAQLELLMEKEDADVICISEVGPYRQIKGYPNYVKSDTHRQSAIFWKRHFKVENIQTDLNKKHTGILTQRIISANELLLIHPYIVPELKNSARGAYWRDLLMALEEWKTEKPDNKIIITGDLNTP